MYFEVYCRSDALPKIEGCIVTKAGNSVDPVYTLVYGPDDLDQCEAWASEQENTLEADSSLDDSDVIYNDAELFRERTESPVGTYSFPVTDDISLLPRNELVSLDASRDDCAFIGSYGPPGTVVRTIMNFLGRGGHSHGRGSSDPIAAGTADPVEQTIGNSDITTKICSGEVAGLIRVRQYFYVPDKPVQTDDLYFDVFFGNLQKLPTSTGISLVGATPTHGDNHWGTPELNAALRSLGSSYYNKFKKPIYINDMSLPLGGLFDIGANFRTPHKTHREGRNADINYSSMNEEQAKYFRTTAEALGFNVLLHGNPLHWHLTL